MSNEDNGVSNTTETQNTTIEPTQTTNVSTPVETKKKSKLLPICLVLIVALCLCLGGFYFYFSTPKKIVASVINKAYAEYDKLVNKDIDFDIKEDSIKVAGDLNIDTNITGFDKLKDDKIAFTAGVDYKNKKIEGGVTFKEKNKTLADIMAYIIKDTGYITLGDDYKGLINYGDVDFDDMLDLEDLEEIDFDKDDLNYIVKAYKDILIDSIDEDDLEKSTDTLKINGKDTKVNKVTYKITDKKVEKLAKNIINATLDDKELLKKLAKITGEDVDDIKDNLKDTKDDLDIDNDDLKMTLNIYTKGFTNSFAGLTLKIDDDTSLNVVANKDDSVITVKADNIKAEFTVKEYNDEKVDIDYNIKYDEEKISGNLTVTAKETKKDNYKGSISFDLKYGSQKLSVKMNYEMEIGAKIADVNTSNAVTYDEAEEDIDDALEIIKNRLESSNIGDLFDSFDSLLGTSSSYYDYDDYDYSDYYSSYYDTEDEDDSDDYSFDDWDWDY